MDSETHEKALRLFKDLDPDGQGALFYDVMRGPLKEICPDATETELDVLLKTVDVNGDGYIQYDEFLRWLRMPPLSTGVKVSFEESLRMPVVGAGGMASDSPSVRHARDFGTGPNPELGVAASEGDARDKGHMHEEEDDILLDSFTHPLLSCFSVCQESKELTPDTIVVKMTSSYRRQGGSVRRRTNIIEVTALDLSSAHMADLLAAMAEVYKSILEAFIEIGGAQVLRLIPVSATEKGYRDVSRAQQPQPLWSAVALALSAMNSKQQKLLSSMKIELCGKGKFSVEAFQDVLAAKVGNAGLVRADAEGSGRIPERKGGYAWCRKDNDPDARLWRLEAFVQSQRAVYLSSFEIQESTIELGCVQAMIDETKVLPAPPFHASPVEDTTPAFELLKRVDDLDPPPSGTTVMEVASSLTDAGYRVVAINAASAYQVGGGVSTGGRHALEEAWCISSTLYQSLACVEPVTHGSMTGYRQHIPATSCVCTPHVQVFRESTDLGYGFLRSPTAIAGVVSVAMFNRNPRVSDSPLDSPDQPEEYLAQTRMKLEAAVLAAVETLNAEVLVVPDVGCGVFMNDPYVIGGSLGSVLRRHHSKLHSLRKVVLASIRQEFSDACERAFNGQDPRPFCPDGASCLRKDYDSAHNARFRHTEEESSEQGVVDGALLMLATYPPPPEEKPKNPCRYGRSCHIQTPEHLARFSHPPGMSGGSAASRPGSGAAGSSRSHGAGLMGAASRASALDSPARVGHAGSRAGLAAGRPWSAAGANPQELPVRVPSRPIDSPLGRREALPAPEDGGLADVSSSNPISRPICRYGEACYNIKPQHLADFAHPWLEGGETDAAARERRAIQESHTLLNKAKGGKWQEIDDTLARQPDLVDRRPDGRQYALLHYAAYQLKEVCIDMLLKHGADPLLRNLDGDTPADIIKSVMRSSPSPVERDKCQQCLLCLARGRHSSSSSSGRIGSDPTSSAHRASPTQESEDGNMRIKVQSCMVKEFDGEYKLLEERLNGHPAYRKDAQTDKGCLYIYHHRNPRNGWSIGYHPEDEADPLAFLGATRSDDPCTRAHLQYWRVLFMSKYARGDFWATDYAMTLTRISR
eukprot:TRINITY_DN6204_c1_g1_i1.p1 TRINITY_DN6204_c1_g1~~TRINITY_DN6204_c1_g1_i1.p1  ORF type:complete len:1100 (-),score=172.77 TRINITY_DN6204_c1_g1_i1:533-3811(-)